MSDDFCLESPEETEKQKPGQGMANAVAGGGSEESRGRRDDEDFFPTPDDVTRALMQAFPPLAEGGLRIWEPHCGEGHIARVLTDYGHHVEATDLVDRGFGESSVDFLTAERREVDAIVMNPPFEGMLHHIKRALSLGYRYVFCITKSGYWQAKERLGPFAEHPPTAIWAPWWKVDFTGGGAAIFHVQWNIWQRGCVGEHCVYGLLDRPTDERQAPLFGGA